MTVQSKITAKGQTTVPLEVREALGLRPGDRVEYVIRDGKVEIFARNLRAVELMGLLGPPPSGRSLSLEEIDDAIADAVIAEHRRIEGQVHKGKK